MIRVLWTGRSAPEFCEIEIQGARSAIVRLACTPFTGWNADLRLRPCLFNLRGSLDRPPFIDELQPFESALWGASRVVLRRIAFRRGSVSDSSYLVDPASSHMLVSKIKPCMSKYKQICTVKLRMAH
jgi:hypothetical protein